MGKILAGALMPHPPLLIPAIGRESLERVSETSTAVKNLAEYIVSLAPDTIIILSPHGFNYQEQATMIDLPEISGNMANFGLIDCKLDCKINLGLTNKIYLAARQQQLAICKLSREMVVKMPELDGIQLDAGAFVPLHFLYEAGFAGEIVHICPCFNDIWAAQKLGEIIAQVVAQDSQDVVLIASGDLSHYLKDTPPYGFRPEGVEFDARVNAAIKDNELAQLGSLDKVLLERAGECGLRPLLAVMAALPEMITEFYSYENSFGVGYTVASWEKYAGSLATKTGNSLPVRLASWTLRNYFQAADDKNGLPKWSGNLDGQAGAFVSLKKGGRLRGCMGTFLPRQATLQEEIYQNTLAAAFKDPRFPPLEQDELAGLLISVDILSYPEKIHDVNQLDVRKYGILVVNKEKSGLLLPDLEGVDNVEEQLCIARQKAGIQEGEKVDIYRFTVERYV